MARTAQAPDRLADLPEICSVADILAVFPVSRATLYRMAEQGQLPSFRVGRRVLISREHLIDWMDRELAGMPGSCCRLSTGKMTDSNLPRMPKSVAFCAVFWYHCGMGNKDKHRGRNACRFPRGI